ncbi:MAG: magnesium chelatase [Cytophagales bacterium]|nr:MAG: magnesium chelatase [Cytophagales bacterium]TAF61684.1 MAG: magnesium chelatase [Cytophagales bacterium]
MTTSNITTLGELKKSGYQSLSIKDELRKNLIAAIKAKKNPFEEVYGYEHSVIPDLQRAILSRHNINLLGLRGQAKTRLARLMVNLLDEYVPVVKGSEINDDPLKPLSIYAKELIAEKADQTPIGWLHRSERYTEKLATPDVSVADLVGDLDPIKAANNNLTYADERVIHFGLIPRSHRGIFVINELPDLQARIQVALFNILQEGDIQIRGFKLRLPLDIQFVFTANPEDYTNRGSIVTPLKDRIGSQILTHYPENIDIAKRITQQEAKLTTHQKEHLHVPNLALDLIEQIAFEARNSEYVDAKSGVSARLTISAYENLLSAAERRLFLNNEKNTCVRIADFIGVLPAIAGKIELVYEGEQTGTAIVAQNLIGKAIRTLFLKYFPDPESEKKLKKNTYKQIVAAFDKGKSIDLLHDQGDALFQTQLANFPHLAETLIDLYPQCPSKERYFFMEFLLHGLAEYSLISKHPLAEGLAFKDFFSSMLGQTEEEDLD